MQKLIEKIFPLDKLKETVLRFPLSVFCASTIFLIAFLFNNKIIDSSIKDFIIHIYMILSLSFLWFVVAKLIAESLRWNVFKLGLISVAGALALFVLLVFSKHFLIHFAFLLPALLLGIMFAPYFKGGDNHSIWYFNRVLWFGVALSFLASLFFATGLSLALLAIHFLFKVDISGHIYTNIWLFSGSIFGLTYALSWVPKKFRFTKDECKAPLGFSFIANWIFVPIVFVYLLILYAYFIKIVITGEVPNGHLTYMINGLVGVGIITYLGAWLLRGSKFETPQLRLFYKIFSFALFVPIVFHFYAIWERINAYGITEQRYLLIIFAIWFAVIAITQILPRKSIRLIPMSLCLLMALASFGPWGAVNVSGNSQFSRLEILLNQNNLLKDGKVVKSEGTIPKKDRINISSILNYLCKSGRGELIKPWFSSEKKKDWKCSSGYNLTKKLGFEYISSYTAQFKNKRFHMRSKTPTYLDVSKYDIILNNNIYVNLNKNNKKPWTKNLSIKDNIDIKMNYDRNILKVKIGNYESIAVNIIDIVKTQIDLGRQYRILIIEGDNSDLYYKIILTNINGDIINNEPRLKNLSFRFLYKIKKL